MKEDERKNSTARIFQCELTGNARGISRHPACIEGEVGKSAVQWQNGAASGEATQAGWRRSSAQRGTMAQVGSLA